MTPRDIITLALKVSGVNGVGQTPRAEDLNDCFTVLNMMLDTWQRKRWLVWHLQDITVPLDGSTSYTIGDGGTINVPRPDRIEGAYARQTIAPTKNRVDYPLRVIDDREEYSSIMLKTITSAPPSLIFYDSAFPLGVIYVYPSPVGFYELHILVKQSLNEFVTLSEPINLPPEYRAALLWNLALEIRPLYQLPPDQTIAVKAGSTLQTIRIANTQIAPLALPAGLPGAGRGSGPSWGGFVESVATVEDSLLS